mmetsp:Transcript_13561/g.34102  ORF Transcript_13561/g.34102 Transcript_13561/m.34102 type:complete len:286 (+) Transcript_13561:153-1010(+)
MRRACLGQRRKIFCLRGLPKPSRLRERSLQQPRGDCQAKGRSQQAQDISGKRLTHGSGAERQGRGGQVDRQLPACPHSGQHGICSGPAGCRSLRAFGSPDDTGRRTCYRTDLTIGIGRVDSSLQSRTAKPVLRLHFLFAPGRKSRSGGCLEGTSKERSHPTVSDAGGLDGRDGWPRLLDCGHTTGDLRRAHLDGSVSRKGGGCFRSSPRDDTRGGMHGRCPKGTQFLPKDKGAGHGRRRKHGRVHHHPRQTNLCDNRKWRQNRLHTKDFGHAQGALSGVLREWER